MVGEEGRDPPVGVEGRKGLWSLGAGGIDSGLLEPVLVAELLVVAADTEDLPKVEGLAMLGEALPTDEEDALPTLPFEPKRPDAPEMDDR